VLAVYAFLVASLIMLGVRLGDREWMSAGFALACATGNAYAIFVLIGWRESLADLQLWLHTPAGPRSEQRLAQESHRQLLPKPQIDHPLNPNVVLLSARRELRNVLKRDERRHRTDAGEVAMPFDEHPG
jgi:hypothetical protein